MTGILENIVERTREHVAAERRKVSAGDFASFELYEQERRDFHGALLEDGQVRIIAEVKKASPSKGVIREHFDPVALARSYEQGGAAALSILTEPYFFQGSPGYLQQVRSEVSLPCLRKDFIVDVYQLEQARALGADAVLLIVKITDGNELYELHDAARELGLQTLVECYDEADWNRLDFSRFNVVGVNNRNLDTFEVNLHRGVSMLQTAPQGVVRVSESGLNTAEDLVFLKEHGIHSALIGEHFMRCEDPGAEVSRFLAPFKQPTGNRQQST